MDLAAPTGVIPECAARMVNKDIYFSYPCRRHSCALINIPRPCVNKIISHIDGLETKIQEHLKRFETSLEKWARISSQKASKEWSIVTSLAEVKPEDREKCPELKKEIETLLAEAIHLIKSLETDRAEAEAALLKQKLRREKLSLKIDSWSIWRLQKIPLAVQKEHDAYLRDIIELRWHIDNKTRKVKYLQEQKENLEKYNAQIQADIDYMQNQTPLLMEKQRYEFSTLQDHYKKKYEAMELFQLVNNELQEVTENCEGAKLKAKKMKEQVEIDIDNGELSLRAYKREIEKLDYIITIYSTSADTISVNIEKEEVKLSDSEKISMSATMEITTLTNMLEELKRDYEQLVQRKKNMNIEYLTAFNEYHAAKRIWNIELAEIEKDRANLSFANIKIREENKKLAHDIELLAHYINDSIRKKSEIDSEIHAMLKMILKNDQLHKYLHKRAYQIGALFHLTRYKLEDVEEKIAEVRRKFKGREDFLKTRIRCEVAKGLVDQEKQSNILKEIEAAKSQTTLFQTKINQLDMELGEMKKERKSLDLLIGNSKDDLETTNYKKEQIHFVFKYFLDEKKNCQKRLLEDEQGFKQTYSMRIKTLVNIKEIQRKALNENLRLAQEYLKLQNNFFTEKKNFLKLYDIETPLDSSVADIKQLCELQKIIFKVWRKHFELVVLYHKMKLAHFQSFSQESIQKIFVVQTLFQFLLLNGGVKLLVFQLTESVFSSFYSAGETFQ
ncbi:coiled-coil domain-containing protein 178 [Suncus etruscus]|uniref:coiled-coil domain-containing protein 178 n=1 Tax=Suncus etruscus TaxID=109475 RepID=UPI002110DB01|nr:coiled-coil domain-containing protein 178 [Suncus etruscus]